jgi:hypothetical protein
VTVFNASTIPDEGVVLQLALPKELSANLGPGLQAPPGVQGSVDANNVVRFTAVPALAPGDRLVFTIPLIVKGPAGIPDVVADVRSKNVRGSEAENRSVVEIVTQ